MTPDISLLVLQAAGGLCVGLALGFIHFRSLYRVSADYLGGRAVRAIALQLARLAILGVVLFLLVKVGALCLLGGAGGMMLARRLVMRGMRENAP